METISTIFIIGFLAIIAIGIITTDVATRKLVHCLFDAVEKLEKEVGIETTPVTFTRENEQYQLLQVSKRLDKIRDFHRYPNYREKVLSDTKQTTPQGKE